VIISEIWGILFLKSFAEEKVISSTNEVKVALIYMQILNVKKVFCVCAILPLFAMPVESQIVSIDTIQSQTTLDKKATIAIGNQLKEGAGYKTIFNEQTVLVDSLFKQIDLQRQENDVYRNDIVPTLKSLNNEKDHEIRFINEKMELKEENHKAQIKSKNGNFWKGVGGGTLLGLLLMVVFGG